MHERTDIERSITKGDLFKKAAPAALKGGTPYREAGSRALFRVGGKASRLSPRKNLCFHSREKPARDKERAIPSEREGPRSRGGQRTAIKGSSKGRGKGALADRVKGTVPF